MLTKQKRTLQTFEAVKLNEAEMHFLNGGAPVSGGGLAPVTGSKYTYSGDLSLTHTETTSHSQGTGGSVGGFSATDTHTTGVDGYCNDFCGTVTLDGIAQKQSCWIGV